jgi:predicted lipoprotein with Yx(FWY)xxD motif
MTSQFKAKAFVNESKTNGTPVTVFVEETPLATSNTGGALQTRKTKADILKDTTGLCVIAYQTSEAGINIHMSLAEKNVAMSAAGVLSALSVLKKQNKLKNEDTIVTLENGMRIACRTNESGAFIAANPASYEEFPMEEMMPLMLSFGLSMADVIPTAIPMIVESDIKTLVFPVAETALDKMEINQKSLDELSERLGVLGITLLQKGTDAQEHTVECLPSSAMMFAGVAAHMQAVAAGGYLYDIDGAEETTFTFKEGRNTITIQMLTDESGFKTPFIGGHVVIS